MEKEKTAVEEFEKSLPKDGDEAFPDDSKQEEETPADSQPDKTSTDTSPSHQGDTEDKEEEKTTSESEEKTDDEEEKVPFHKHPRWKQVQKSNKDLKDNLVQAEKDISYLKGVAETKTSAGQETEPIPEWFGGDEEKWKQYRDRESRVIAQAEKRVEDKFAKQKTDDDNRLQEASEFVDDRIQELKDEGNKFDKNKLMKFMTENRPSTPSGDLDFRQGLKLMQKLEEKDPEKLKARKKIVSKTSSDSQSEPDQSDFQTTESLKGKGFRDY